MRRRAALQLGAGAVTAAAHLAARALHAVDQLAIEIADLRSQPALAEIELIGRRRLVVGEVENADIDRGDYHLGVFAGAEPAKLDRQTQIAGRPHQGRRRQRHRQRARRLVDPEPFQADGAAGHALRGGIERTAQRRDQIGARAPILADRELDLVLPFLDVDALGQQQPVAEHIDGELAGATRIDGHHHGVA